MRKFWNWVKNEEGVEELRIGGYITDDDFLASFFDSTTPNEFKEQLNVRKGDITVWINSPGGETIAASQIYTMLKEYNGNITVKVDGIAWSAASIIAMASDNVLLSPTALLMIHNPLMGVYGEVSDMEQAINVLNEVKESIINAYQLKTGLPRTKISRLMDAETFMNARSAIEIGFADGMLYGNADELESVTVDRMTSVAATAGAFRSRFRNNKGLQKPSPVISYENNGVPIESLEKRLNLIIH